MKRFQLALIILLLVTPAFSADKWVRIQSKNYTLVGNATENQIRDVAESLEVFRSAFSKFFKVKEGSSVATTVVVFKSDQAFKPFKPLYKGKPANVAGYFQSGSDMNFIALAADDETPRVIYHELVHRLMSDSTGSLPPWFQEGFAECFSTIEIEGRDKKVRIGRAIGEHVELLNQREFMPLAKLFAVEHGSPEYNEEEKQGLFYAESWALVHYMMFDSEQRRSQFNAFLSGIADGMPADRAFEQVFHTDLNSFQKVFEAYIQQHLAWNAFELNTPTGLDRNKDITSKVISEAETEFYLGDLMLHIDRLPDADTHLTKAVQLDPKLGGAQSSMGRLLMEKKNEALAMPYLQRATELSPDNYLTHFYYATALRVRAKSPSDPDFTTMRLELQKTVKLAPQFVEAAAMLANSNLALNIDIDQTAEMLSNAITISPGRDDLELLLANALSRTERRDTARAIVRSLLAKQTLEGWIRQNAQSLMSYLDRVAASEPARRTPAAPALRDAQPQPQPLDTDLANSRPPDLRRTPPADSATPLPPERPKALLDEPQLPPGTQRIQGVLTALECKDGLTLVMTINGKTQRFHSSKPENIKFTSANSSVVGEIACGPTPNKGVPATIIYRTSDSSNSAGDPQSVEFLRDAPAANTTNDSALAIPNSVSVNGFLTDLDCSKGVTVTITSNGRTLKFHHDSASKVAFLNGPNPDGTVNCGPVSGSPLPVTVLYRPATSGDFQGEPVIVQFQKK